MSTQTVVTNTGNQAIINTNTAKVFLWNRRSEKGQITNGTGGTVNYPEGTVMGRISASGKFAPFASAAVDGTQHPIGVLIDSYAIIAADTQDVFICVAGDVAEEKLIFQGGDTLETVISGQRVRDILQGKSVGIKLVKATEMTTTDNQ